MGLCLLSRRSPGTQVASAPRAGLTLPGPLLWADGCYTPDGAGTEGEQNRTGALSPPGKHCPRCELTDRLSDTTVCNSRQRSHFQKTFQLQLSSPRGRVFRLPEAHVLPILHVRGTHAPGQATRAFPARARPEKRLENRAGKGSFRKSSPETLMKTGTSCCSKFRGKGYVQTLQ